MEMNVHYIRTDEHLIYRLSPCGDSGKPCNNDTIKSVGYLQ